MGVLEGKAAIVTGSARGIGRATAGLLAEHGARVLVTDLDERVANEAASAMPGETAVFAGDLTQDGISDAVVKKAIDAFGQLDIVVNNAGYTWDGMAHKMSDEQFRAMLEIHTVAPFKLLRAAAPYLRDAGKADRDAGREVFRKVVNVTSISGTQGNLGQANYAAAKLGIFGLTKATALDMARYNVTANCISPFAWTRMIGTIPTETEQQKARVEKIKQMSPAHIAPMAVFLASDAAKDVTGQVFGVRGKELMLFGHERPIMRVHHADGWTPGRIADMFPGTLQHHLVPLVTSGQYFNYDPLV